MLTKMEKKEFKKAKVVASNGSLGAYSPGSAGFRIVNTYCDGHN